MVTCMLTSHCDLQEQTYLALDGQLKDEDTGLASSTGYHASSLLVGDIINER